MFNKKYRNQEKKKEGMLQLENFFKNQLTKYSDDDKKLLTYINLFKNYGESSQPLQTRKNSFLGYLSLINAIKKESKENNSKTIHSELISAIMDNLILNLKDNEPKIVSSAAEVIYNIMNGFKDYVLFNFEKFLDSLLTLVTINDQDVKGIAQNLDSSLKGVINFSFQGQLPKGFNLLDFFKVILNEINLEHPNIKCCIVSWINCINQIPEIKLINILHYFLGELLNMLQIENQDVKKATKECLDDFFNEMESSFGTIPYEVEVKILEILIEKCQLNHSEIKLTSFKWILMFLQKYSFLLIQINKIKSKAPPKNNSKIVSMSSGISENEITDKSDDLSLGSFPSSIEIERKYPFYLFSQILDIILKSSNIFNKEKDKKELEEIEKVINEANNTLLNIIEYYNENNGNLKLFEEILTKHFNDEDPTILKIVFKWIQKLYNKFHENAFESFDNFMENFTYILANKDNEIFKEAINIIHNIGKYKEKNINIVVSKIIKVFKEKIDLIDSRGTDIITILCSASRVDTIFLTFANVLLTMKEDEFVGRIINRLNIFLIKSDKTEDLRNFFKKVKTSNDRKDKVFFEKIFRTWCINPVSGLILCLIAENFELSYNLLTKL